MSITESKPFDCSEVDDDDYDYSSLLPCYENGPQWWQIGRQCAWSMFFWFVTISSSPILKRIWEAYGKQMNPIWVQDYVGTKYRLAHHTRIEAFLCIGQFIASSALVFFWISKSYFPQHEHRTYFAELICVLICYAHMIFNSMKNSFSWDYALSLTIFIDCLTLPPVVMQKFGAWAGGSWLTLAYLRVYEVYKSTKRLVELDFFDTYLTNFMQECILAALECLVVVFAIAGTLFVMEGLGDIEGFSDTFVDSGMGSISFFQMLYFSFVTISTVGFGDYSPTTVLSRGFIIFAILGGVSFFSYISVHIMQLVELESSGRGHFFPSKKSSRGHILVTGGGVTCGSLTVLETFLCALCRDDPFFETPEIVLMGQTPCSPQVRELISNSEWALKFHIQYFVGSPLNEHDLIRVRASEVSMIFIIADFQATDTQTEDRTNLLFAASIQETLPITVQYRLMLCSMHSRILCSNIGLSEFNCFSIENLKAGMLGTSHRCPGFSTLILNLGLPDLPVPNTPFSPEVLPNNKYGKWLKEYAIGCSLEPYAFQPIDFLVGLTFREASIQVAKTSNVLLVAGQFDGAIIVNPSKTTIQAKTILFCFAEDLSALNPIAKNNNPAVATWIAQFQENRRVGTFKSRQHAKVVHMRTAEEVEQVYQTNLEAVQDEGIQRDTNAKFKKDSMENDNDNHEGGGDGGSHNGSVPRGAGIPVMSGISEAVMSSNSSLNTGQSGSNRVMMAAARAKKRSIRDSISRIRMSATVEDIDVLRQQVLKGGHTVVIMLEDQDGLDEQTIWEQLAVIIKCLIYARDHTPLIVAHTLSALPSRCKFLKKHGNLLKSIHVSFCVGDVLDPSVLQAAGCHTCGRILTIAPSAPPMEKSHFDNGNILSKSDDKMDEAHIFLMKILNEYKQVWNRSEHVNVIFDWYSPNSMNVLPVPRLTSASSGTILDDKGRIGSTIETREETNEGEVEMTKVQETEETKDNSQPPVSTITSPKTFSPNKVSPLPPLTASSTHRMDSSTDSNSLFDNQIALSPISKLSSTSGESGVQYVASSPVMLGGSRLFSFSSMSDIAEVTVDGKGNEIKRINKDDIEFARSNPRGNCRFAAGFTIPKPFIAALYSMAYYTPGSLELIEALLVPSQYDQSSITWLFKMPKRFVGKEYKTLAFELLEEGALPLGLLRPGGVEAGTPFPYVVTLVPTSDLILSDGDNIYAISDHEWALQHAKSKGFYFCYNAD